MCAARWLSRIAFSWLSPHMISSSHRQLLEGRQLDLAGCGRSAGGRGRVPCGLRYPLLEQQDAPEASWTAAARRDGVSSCFSIISSESAVQSAVLSGLGMTAPSAPGAARLASWITRRRSVVYVGTAELRLEDWWLSPPLSRLSLAVVDGCLLGGTGA